MNKNDDQSTDFERKIEFLSIVLESEEKRRESVENKFSVLTASNALLLSVITGLGIQATGQGFLFWFQLVLVLTALAASLVSLLWSTQILTTLGGSQKRSQIVDIGTDPDAEYNLVHFASISKYKKVEFLYEINLLHEQVILEQLTAQVHNISRLLIYRYRILKRSHRAFIAAMVIFAIFVFVNGIA